MLQPDRETRAEWTKIGTAFVEDFIEGLEAAPASSPGTALLFSVIGGDPRRTR